ncbi:hypothetical protein CBOM_05687, partial [Ceraceosorus bombacis]
MNFRSRARLITTGAWTEDLGRRSAQPVADVMQRDDVVLIEDASVHVMRTRRRL